VDKTCKVLTFVALLATLWTFVILPSIEPIGSGGFALHVFSLVVGLGLLSVQVLFLAYSVLVRRHLGWAALAGFVSCALYAINVVWLFNS